MKTDSGQKSILALDLVRGLAALAVMVGHIRVGAWIEYGALPAEQKGVVTAIFFMAARLGHEAVLIFFVLSGFLVGGKLLVRVKADDFRIADYALDRATRIFLPLIPACLLTVGVNYFFFGLQPDLIEIGGNMVGFNGVTVGTLFNNAPLWSAAFEIWFYVLGSVIAWMLSGRANALSAIVLVVCVLVFAKLSPVYLLFWALGSLTTLLIAMRGGTKLAIPGSAILAGGVVLYQLGTTSKSFSTFVLVPTAVAEAMVCTGFCLCIPLLCKRNLNRIFLPIEKPVRFLSGISFSIYLTHMPIVAALRIYIPQASSVDLKSVGMFALSVIVAFANATVFWWLFERRTQVLRQMLGSKLISRTNLLVQTKG